jgi:hypothetical protein
MVCEFGLGAHSSSILWFWSTVIWLFVWLADDSTLVNSGSALTLSKPVESAYTVLWSPFGQ